LGNPFFESLLADDQQVKRLIRKPPALHPGDTIGVVAPAAGIEREYLKRGVAALEKLGFQVKVSPHALDRVGILAGEDQVRAGELAAFFADPEIKAIFAARGGYGCGRLLPLLDFDAFAQTPKIFVGFSDETFLLNALVDKSHIITFHGPMVAMDFARGVSLSATQHLLALLMGTRENVALEAQAVLHPGDAEGELIGGCLSVLVAMIGTPWEPQFDGRILFLEDTGEKAYRIDRMLTQLQQAGILDRVAGVVFGAIRPVNGNERESELMREFIDELSTRARCPVLFGIEAGHGSENFALPIGASVRLEGAKRRLSFIETAVEA
jgi:muramoyltetrapeptide carboxypeptidase